MVLWIGTSPSPQLDGILMIFVWMLREIFTFQRFTPLPVWQMMEPLSGEREKMHLYLAMDLQILGMGNFIGPKELPKGRVGIYMLQIKTITESSYWTKMGHLLKSLEKMEPLQGN